MTSDGGWHDQIGRDGLNQRHHHPGLGRHLLQILLNLSDLPFGLLKHNHRFEPINNLTRCTQVTSGRRDVTLGFGPIIGQDRILLGSATRDQVDVGLHDEAQTERVLLI